MAVVTSIKGEITAVQSKTANPKRSTNTGWLGRGSVRLSEPKDAVLGLAEGVETALSATELFGVPCWATLGALRMDTVWVPPTITEIFLFGDNDEPGRAAVTRAVERHRAEGRIVRERFPVEFNDWNDVLRRRSR